MLRTSLVAFLLLTSAVLAGAQSRDQSTPAPVRSNNLVGHIAARDIGDSRLTQHYYAFTGTPGDVLITVQSRNLNGDIDVFTAVGLRPLLKLTMYAESSAQVTKGIYLRKREDLILRVEARSPNDDEGTYQIFFGGSFEPVIGGTDVGPEETAAPETATTGGGKTKRVSSVGARLPEPEPPVTEVAAAPTPAPTPSATPVETVVSTPEKPTAESTRPTTSRTNPRTRQPSRRTSSPTPVKPTTSEPVVEATRNEEKSTEPKTEGAEEPAKPKPTPRSSATRRNTPTTSTARTTKPTPAPEPEPEPEAGPRLVIETNDGTLINRSMNTVRRVNVENGWVVVTGKDGKIDRILLTNVVRMSIAP